MMRRIDQVMVSTARQLSDAGVSNPRLDARLLLQTVIGLEAEDIAREPGRPMDEEAFDKLQKAVSRRTRREPVSRIIGNREFWSIDFAIAPDVLDPRPESETLIDALLACVPDRSKRLTIADLGTGSGCLLCAALSEYPNARGIGVDKSAGALSVANGNARRLGLGERAHFLRGHWTSAVAAQSIDVVLANPPYIPRDQIGGLAPEVANFDPRMALDGGEDGLDAYRSIARELQRIIEPGGNAFIEVGAGQAEIVSAIFDGEGVERIETIPDLGGRLRCVTIAYKKNGR